MEGLVLRTQRCGSSVRTPLLPPGVRGLHPRLSPLSPPQGASALFDMIEYYESATHLNISFNKHIGTRGWQAAAHMMRKVGASPATSPSFQGGGSSGIEGSRCFVRAPSFRGIGPHPPGPPGPFSPPLLTLSVSLRGIHGHHPMLLPRESGNSAVTSSTPAPLTHRTPGQAFQHQPQL